MSCGKGCDHLFDLFRFKLCWVAYGGIAKLDLITAIRVDINCGRGKITDKGGWGSWDGVNGGWLGGRGVDIAMQVGSIRGWGMCSWHDGDVLRVLG